jgi:antitoxin MazE
MKARIIRIGNSRGVRIPESLLEQSHLAGDVRIEARRTKSSFGRLRAKGGKKPFAPWPSGVTTA